MLICFIVLFPCFSDKNSLSLSMSLIIIQISYPSLLFLKNASSNKKAPPAIVEGFQMSLFDLNYTLEKVSVVGQNC